MPDYYILDGHEAVAAELMEWAKWFEEAERTVRKSVFSDCKVSTVFLGLDHSFGNGPIQVFETMVFGGLLDQETERYETWELAAHGHDTMCMRVTE